MFERAALLTATALTGLMLAASPAAAFDATEDYYWTGIKLGASFGMGMGVSQWEQVGFGDYGQFGFAGFNGGIFLGGDVELAPGIVFGLEAGFSFVNAEASPTQDLPQEDYYFRTLGIGYAGIRGGVEVAPRTLLYGRAAYAAIHAQSSDDVELPPNPQQEFLHGYQVAVGIETEVMDNVTLRVEGAYTDAISDFVVNAGNDVYRPRHLAVNMGLTYRFPTESTVARAEAITGPLRSWTGGYLGAYGTALASSTENGLRTYIQAEGPVSNLAYAGGLFIGANVQLGEQFVAGLEAEAGLHDISWDFVRDESKDIAESDHKGSISARFGFLSSPQTLFYVKGGWGMMHILPIDGFAEIGTEPQYIQTLSAGVGVETMVNENMLLRAEGVYTTAVEDYRFTDGTDDFFVRPEALEARVAAAFLF